MMLRRRFFRLHLGLGGALLLASTRARADDSADAIIKRAVARDGLGLEGGHASLTMTVIQEDGSTEARTFEVWTKK